MTSQNVASQAQAAPGLPLQRENAGAEATAALLHRALEHQQAGRAQDAFILLEQILNDDPTHHQALNLMGVLAMGLGDTTLAGDLFQRAVHASPKTPLYHCNLGKVRYAQNDIEGTVTHFRQALALQPDMAETHYDLAVVLEKEGQIEPAAQHYHEALKLRPDYVEALRGLGVLHKKQGRMDEALDCYKKVIALNPDHAETYNSMAQLYFEQGQRSDAIQAYRQAIRLKSDFSGVYVNLGRLLAEEGRYEEAIQAYEMALQLDAEDGASYVNYASLLNDLGQHNRARALLQRALDRHLKSAELYNNLGAILTIQGHLAETIQAYEQAILIKPGFAISWSNLLLTLQYVEEITADEVFAWHVRFAEQIEAPLKPLWQPHANSRDVGRRLKIGYVSGDFRNHAAAYFFEPVLRGHDPSRFETFCYYTFHGKDAMTAHYMTIADHWMDCSKVTDDALAKRIREDGIDILVDLSGHTAHNRLPVFARKPAPVQVTWIGYAGTTGLTAMDYRLTAASMDPPGQTERYHSEKLIRLAHATAYQPPEHCPEVNPLPALSQGYVTFASLNVPKKINQRVANLWGRILHALPGSRLMLGGIADDETRQRLVDLFAQAGVDERRLVLNPWLSIQDYMALHHQIDLGLDPFPYNGGTTTIHALWMGVPVVSMQGDSSVSRGGATILSRVDLESFVTHGEEEYLQRVMALASDLPALDALRQTLRSRMMSANNDSGLIVRDLESVYRDMWRTWCESGT